MAATAFAVWLGHHPIMSNIASVQALYAAFSRGDLPHVLSTLSESVQWGYDDPSTDLPWLQPQRGRAGAARFFESFGMLQMNSFEPKTFFETGDLVVVLVDEDVTVRANGRHIPRQEQVHIWKFGEDGLITAHYWQVDTHRHWAAVHGQ